MAFAFLGYLMNPHASGRPLCKRGHWGSRSRGMAEVVAVGAQ